MEGAGIDLELKQFNSMYNSEGDKVILEAGSMKNLTSENRRSSSAALTLTNHCNEDQSPGHKELVIRSPYIKAALKAVIPAYRNIKTDLKHIVIIGQPRCLFHYRDELRAYCANLQDETAVKHVIFLMKYMCKEFATQISLYRDNMIVDRGTESLDHQCLWMAFRPGDLIYVSAKGHEDERIYRLISMEYKEGFLSTFSFAWSIKALCIVSDGKKFGEHQVDFMIDQFNGIRQLHELPVFPLKYHPEAARIHTQLLNRGKKFCGLYSSHYRRYSGVAELLDDNNSLPLAENGGSFSGWSTTGRPTTVNGRIIIDPKAFSQTRPTEQAFIPAHRKSFDPKLGEHRHMSDEEYVICNSKVAGYSPHNKKWGYFRVDLIDEVVFNETAFDSLILDAQQKQRIQSLVHIHGHEKLKTADINRDKGKGLVILLYGEAGTGKTLTVESVADNTRRPLLRLDASSLGTTAESVEKGLRAALRFSKKWNAVALLDDADLFLTQRKGSDLEHNGIISVFFRALENYKGILFLTANRISVFDGAIRSRIHLAIHYPKPSRTSRQSLWNLFLFRSSAESAEALRSNGTLDRIADEKLNGRQIKNTVQLAYSLALHENSFIKPHHISTVLQQLKHLEEDSQNRTECVKRKRTANDSDGHQEHPAKRHQQLPWLGPPADGLLISTTPQPYFRSTFTPVPPLSPPSMNNHLSF
ncbi:P-loop containing nucleoside triphosphate hydrolase protein [Trichoderma evansii]